MPKKFIPYYPDTIQGQAILNNITRTKRILKYRDSDKVYERIKRGLPLYDVDTIEQVRKSPSSQEGDLEVVKNLVIRGECISACAYLKQKGIKVDLVYIDPPFASGADYAKKVFIRRNPQLAEEIKKAEETLDIDELRSFEEKMYGDVWNKEDYLNWMYENLVAIKSVMSETASIYVHIDWHIGHYIKILLDEVFGEDNFNNEIIWAYRRWTAKSKTFQNSHDIIYWYSKTENYIWNQIFEDYADAEAHFTEEDDNGKYRWQYLRGEKYKLYLREGIRMKDWWDDISYINSMATERLDYSTQKPEEVLKDVLLGRHYGNNFFSNMGEIKFLRQEFLRNDLIAFLSLVGFKKSETEFILTDKVSNATNYDQDKSLFVNNDLMAYIKEKEWLYNKVYSEISSH